MRASRLTTRSTTDAEAAANSTPAPYNLLPVSVAGSRGMGTDKRVRGARGGSPGLEQRHAQPGQKCDAVAVSQHTISVLAGRLSQERIHLHVCICACDGYLRPTTKLSTPSLPSTRRAR